MIRFSARSAYLLLVPQRRALIGDRALVWDRALRNRLFPCFKVFEIVKMGARTLIAELSFRHSFYLVRVVRVEDIRVAWLVYLDCLRSNVLRAYCNFESKQAISITLFGRRPNNKVRNLTSHGISNIQELLMLRCLHFPLTLIADRIESVK